MDKFSPSREGALPPPARPERKYRALSGKGKEDPLAEFTPEEQAEIRQKLRMLSALAYFIGKDFRIPVEFNAPGGGWHWDFAHNVIRVDPKTLLERPIDELRYLICHEGGHRRVSRMDFIPLDVWRQPGFSAMSNFIEDPRNDNFVAESYPTYRENVDAAWSGFFEAEKKKTEEAAMDRLGTKPRFVQAGYEYIRQWFEEIHDREAVIPADLPEEVKEVVQATIGAAKDSWWRYPAREEADTSEDLIGTYARVSYEINRDRIWPEFKKLIEADLEDQKTQEFLKDVERQQSQGDGGGGVPQDLKDELSPEEQNVLEDAIRKAIDQAKKEQGKQTREKAGGEGPKPIDLDSLSDELKKKIKKHIDSLPEDEKRELAKKAEAALKEFEDALNEELQGRLSDDPERKAERDEREKEREAQQAQGGEPVRTGTLRTEPLDLEGLRIYKERLERSVNADENVYEKYRSDVMPLVETLEAELRQIFVDRKVTAWKGGFRSGKRIDIKRRIQEKAKRIPAMESKAWQNRERPDEKDHAITLLNDLSGSMRGKTIEEDFKAKVVLAEVLNKLGIQVEILGFNDEMYEYQNFGEPMSKQIRAHMGGMFKEVEDSCCKNCGNEHSETDLGWAITQAAERLAKQKAANKMLIVLTDGKVAESSNHPRNEFDPKKITQKISDETDIVPIDPGSISGKTVAEIIDRLKEQIIRNL